MKLKSIFSAVSIIAFFSLISKFIGLLRDRVLASEFGASSTLDIYYSAFKIPDLIFNLIILGAVSAAIIPVFLEYRTQDRIRGWQVVQNAAAAGFFSVMLVCLIVLIFADYFAFIVAPGITGEDRETLVVLMRLMLLSPIFFSMSAVFGAVLQALERFLAYSIAPIFYNLGIIFGALWLVPLARQAGYHEVIGLGLGVVLGAFLHFLIQSAPVISAGFKVKFTIDFSNPGLRKIIQLMIPRTLALGTYSIGLAITNAFASALGVGAITVLNLATNIQFLPVSILGISMATASFPKMSSYVSEGDYKSFKSQLNQSMKGTALSVTLVALAVILLRKQIVELLFGLGEFASANIQMTSTLLGIFMLGVTSQSLMHIVTRAYYALQDTRTPFWVSIGTISLMVFLSYLFAFPLGAGLIGLAIASSIAYNANFAILYLILRHKIKRL